MEVYRGDIWFIKRSDATTYGVEQQPGRPAVIISNDTGNHFSNQVEIVYLTSKQKKPMPTHVKVRCDVPSTALCEQVCTIDKERLDYFIKRCTPEEMDNIDNAVMISLGLKKSDDLEERIVKTMVELFPTIVQEMVATLPQIFINSIQKLSIGGTNHERKGFLAADQETGQDD